MLNKQQINKLLSAETVAYYLTNKQNLAMFLAQCDYESFGFTRVEENLNYSASGLLATFPKYFNEKLASNYAHKPENIANYVYTDRMGNADVNSGDGWKYRGRGYIQVTGKINYKVCGNKLQVDLVAKPELLCQPQYAILSALWFWQSKDCSNYVGDVERITKLINGGLNGLQQRNILYNKYLAVL